MHPYSTLMLSILLSTLLVVSAQSSTISPPPSTCGNGLLDEGEQCDPTATQFSSECCTSSCQYASSSKACFGGSGICSLGLCITRGTECSALDSSSFQINSNNGQSGSSPTLLTGPYSTCAVSSANQATISALIQSKTISNSSVLTSLLPSNLASNAKCSNVCSGSTATCIDFSTFTNINSAVANYLSCVVDNSANFDFSSISTSTDIRTQYQKILTPGVCVTGTCRPDICDSTRCNNRGNCVLSPSTVSAMNSSLGITATVSTFSNYYGIITCQCQDGWTGDQCDVSIFQNEGGPDAVCALYAKKEAEDDIIISVLSTAFGCIFIALLLVFFVRTRSNSKNNSKNNSSAFNNAQKRDSVLSKVIVDSPDSPLKDLEELPQIVPFENLLVGEDVEFKERSSSTSDKSILSEPVFEPDTPISQDFIPHEPQVDTVSPPLLPSKIDTTTHYIDTKQHETQQSKDMASPEISAGDLPPVPSHVQNIILPANYLRAAHAYNARLADEINLLPGDIIYLIKAYDDGWAKAYNLRSGREGIFPLSFAKRIVVKDENESGGKFAENGVFAGDVTDDSIIVSSPSPSVD